MNSLPNDLKVKTESEEEGDFFLGGGQPGMWDLEKENIYESSNKQEIVQGIQGEKLEEEVKESEALEKEKEEPQIAKPSFKHRMHIPWILAHEKIEVISSSNYLPDNSNAVSQEISTLLKGSMEHKMKKSSYGKPRYCSLCKGYKPDRCHHCRVCNTCVLKMDHHCPFVGNCVGFRNYKFFFNMLFYGCILINLMALNFHEAISIQKDKRRGDIDFEIVTVLILVYAMIIVLALVVNFFLFFHLYLMLNGMTTIEYREKLNRNYRKVSRIKKSPYNLGYFKNLQNNLGTNPLLWFIPFCNFM